MAVAEDQRLIALARERGWISEEQIARATREQKHLADHGVEHSLWFLVQDLGFISDEQSRELRKNVSSSRLRALQIEGYTIEGRIGSGGMGDVFKAKDAHGRETAIKLLSAKLARNEEHLRRFARESRATLKLFHPHITRSLSAGELDGNRYLLMELVHGKSLKQWISDHGRLPQRDGLVLLRQIADALGYAQAQGVLHRDVKPANIILGGPRPGVDEPFCAKLCDFGLAQVDRNDDSSSGDLTASGLALGTPHYMSPEQASGDKSLDQRTDIYGLGATVYHALLGHTMYTGKSSAVIMYKQVTEALDLDELAKLGIDPRLTALLGCMLAKRRDQRIATWREVIHQADLILGRPDERSARLLIPSFTPPPSELTPPIALPAPPEPPSTARTVAATLALAVTATAALALGGWWWLSASATTAPDELAARLGSWQGGGQLLLGGGPYRAPLRLGPAHAGLTIVGDGRSALAGQISAGPGAAGTVVRDAVIPPSALPPIVESGAYLVFDGVDLGPGATVRGTLVLRRCTVGGAVRVAPGGRVEAVSTAFAGRIEAPPGSVSANACTFAAGPPP